MNGTCINGKTVSKISLGTVQLGLNYGIANNEGQPSLEKSFQILEKAINGGITALDTARGYGNSEDVLGEYFRKNCNDKLFITTKYKCSLGEDATYNEIEKDVFTSVETSLNKLGVDKIDCLLLHNAFYKGVYQGKNIAKAFEKLIARNLVGITGLSMARYIEEIEDMFSFDVFKATQVPMNIFDLRLIKSGLYEKLVEKNIRIFVRSVFFQGLFFLDVENIKNPELKRLVADYLIVLQNIAKRENMSMAELAISFIRDIKGVTSLVIGADNKEQVEENIKYLSSPSISENGRREIEEKLSGVEVLSIMQELAKPKK